MREASEEEKGVGMIFGRQLVIASIAKQAIDLNIDVDQIRGLKLVAMVNTLRKMDLPNRTQLNRVIREVLKREFKGGE
ncbi:MAG: hypothetical protein AB1805_07460 [Nitrospirota bacterium]